VCVCGGGGGNPPNPPGGGGGPGGGGRGGGGGIHLTPKHLIGIRYILLKCAELIF